VAFKLQVFVIYCSSCRSHLSVCASDVLSCPAYYRLALVHSTLSLSTALSYPALLISHTPSLLSPPILAAALHHPKCSSTPHSPPMYSVMPTSILHLASPSTCPPCPPAPSIYAHVYAPHAPAYAHTPKNPLTSAHAPLLARIASHLHPRHTLHVHLSPRPSVPLNTQSPVPYASDASSSLSVHTYTVSISH